MTRYLIITFLLVAFLAEAQLQPLKVSENNRFLQTADGKPFFWLGDTGWLLFSKCSREDAVKYLDTRQKQGFNVIQVMVLHTLDVTNVYGDSAIKNQDPSMPNVTKGDNFNDQDEYDFWDYVDFIIGEAERLGIYMALVPVWGSNIKSVSVEQATAYASFLATRYKDKSNIIWLNGGDVRGSEALDKWNAIGATLRAIDKTHLITYHPRGRNSSSAWFHNEPWLDFNMYQSGHRTYAQDTLSEEKLHFGEDNWKYGVDDYKLIPIKPTIDGEPSYENIPYGLHRQNEPYWQDHEIRRYAYWSVFAGGFGFTYGCNEVMQFYSIGEKGSYFPKQNWQAGLKLPGASQMRFMKDLMLSKSYFDRVPAQSLVIDNGDKYDRILATRGKDYAMFYTYNGREFKINSKTLDWVLNGAYWYNPKDGKKIIIYKSRKSHLNTFNPPGDKKNGNDWVLVLENKTK